MRHLNLFRSICSGLILASTIFATGCDGEQEGDEPRQFVDETVDQDEFEAIITAAELDDAMGVADFFVYKVRDSHEDFARLSQQCTDDPEAYFEGTCGGCICTNDGSVVCVDFSCDDIFGSITFPDTPVEMSPPGPDHDNTRGVDVDDDSPLPGGPGMDHNDLASPEPPTYLMDGEEQVDGPGTDFDTFTPPPMADPDDGMILDEYTESSAFCRDGHAVGAVWQEGLNTCFCSEQRIVGCTLIGTPPAPDSWN